MVWILVQVQINIAGAVPSSSQNLPVPSYGWDHWLEICKDALSANSVQIHKHTFVVILSFHRLKLMPYW